MNIFKFLSENLEKEIDYKCSDEVAANTLLPLLRYYKIDPKKLDMAMAEQKEERLITLGFKQIVDKLITAIRRGNLKIEDIDGSPSFVYTLEISLGDVKDYALTFYPRGSYSDKDYKNMDSEASIQSKTEQLIACMTKKPVTYIQKLKQVDYSVVEVIGHFFLQM